MNIDLQAKFNQMPNLDVDNIKLKMENKQMKIQLQSLALPPPSLNASQSPQILRRLHILEKSKVIILKKFFEEDNIDTLNEFEVCIDKLDADIHQIILE